MKKILAMLLAVIMVFGLVACGESGNNGGTTANGGNSNNGGNTNEVKEFEITVWTPAEDQAEGNNWLTKMEANFETAHPEYKITWINQTQSEGDAGNAVKADVTASADVFMFANDQLGNLITAGGLSQLGGSFEEQVKNDNTELAINSVTHTDGGIYAFPVTNNTWFLYYNTDVFTAEDVKSLDTMLTKGKVWLPFATGWTAGCIFLGCGGSIFGETGRDADAGINFSGTNGGYTAAKKMIELTNNANSVVGDMNVGQLKDGTVDAAFSGSWDAAGVREALGDKMGVAALPSFTADGQEYQMTAMSGTKCVGVNPNSGSVQGKQAACTKFAAYLASEEAQLERYNMRGIIPAHKGLAETDAIKNDPIAIAEIGTMQNASVLQSALPEMSNYWTPVETFGKNVSSGDVNMDNYTQAVDQMNEQLNASGL